MIVQPTIPTEPKPRAVEPEAAKLVDTRKQELRELLSRVDAIYAEDSETIAQNVVRIVKEVEKAGGSVTPTEVLEGSLRWPMPGYFFREKQSEFKEYFSLYLMYRVDGKMNHAQAIRAMHLLSSALHLQSKQSPPPGFEAALEVASPGCQLAMIESHDIIRDNDPLAKYFGGWVDKVAMGYGMDPKLVAAAACFTIGQVQQLNVTTHPDQVLIAALEWLNIPAQTAGQERYLEFLQRYEQVRHDQRGTHAEACIVLLGRAPADTPPDP